MKLSNLNGKKNVLVIMVGPPASGKTTLAKKIAQENDAVHISTDAIRAEIGKGDSDQSVSYPAFCIAKERVSQNLSIGKNVIIDATSCDRKARKDWLNRGRDAGAFVVAVAIEVPPTTLYERDQKRERHVGKEVIDSFVKKYIRPTVEEGFDKVIVL